mmetsp:Transcript_16073/g.23993  ORF Transcript_16073/g.23993 Transcript_16073/m.23993 type:complete len:250 (+) Transcript_16073:6477-7226(+)
MFEVRCFVDSIKFEFDKVLAQVKILESINFKDRGRNSSNHLHATQVNCSDVSISIFSTRNTSPFALVSDFIPVVLDPIITIHSIVELHERPLFVSVAIITSHESSTCAAFRAQVRICRTTLWSPATYSTQKCITSIVTNSSTVPSILGTQVIINTSKLIVGNVQMHLVKLLQSLRTENPSELVIFQIYSDGFVLGCIQQEIYWYFTTEKVIVEVQLTNVEKTVQARNFVLKTICPQREDSKLAQIIQGV